MQRFATAFAVLAFFWAQSPASAKPLTIVADEWPPFSGSNLPNMGLSLDVISSVLKRAGYEVQVAVVPWARIMDGAAKGRYDVIGSLFLTDDMKAHVTYGDAYYTTKVKFLRKVGNAQEFETLQGLSPYSIAVGDGFLYSDSFDQADYLNKLVVTTTLQTVRMVAHGRADLTLDSVEVIQYALENDAPELKSQVEFLPRPLASRSIHMAVRNDLPGRDEIIADFNRTLEEMRRDGSYQRLLDRHTLRVE